MSYSERLAAVKREFPNFTVVEKSHSPLMRLIGVLMFFNPAFMHSFTTTFGHWMWVPSKWRHWSDLQKENILRHEVVHLRQQQRYGFPLFAFLYLFFPLPLGLAWYRARFEWEAYCESIRALSEAYGVDYLRTPIVRERFVEYFTTASYGWMWPFRRQVESWYDSFVQRLDGL